MKILVLACPCSGTRFTHGLFSQLGFKFGLEIIKENGGIGWMFVAEKNVILYSKHVSKAILKDFDFIFHQVRNPLEVVRTLPIETHPMWEYVEDKIGKYNSNSKLEKHLWFWTKWNKLCEEKSQLTYRVEDLPTIVNKRHLKNNTNSKRGRMKLLPRPTWDKVKEVYPETLELAKKYRYYN